MRLAAAFNFHHSQFSDGDYFAGIANPIAITVLPNGNAAEFIARKLAVAIVVEGGQCIVAISPEDPEGYSAEHLKTGCDISAAIVVVNEPPGFRSYPTPAPLLAAAVK